MLAFDNAAAGHFDENRIVSCVLFPARQQVPCERRKLKDEEKAECPAIGLRVIAGRGCGKQADDEADAILRGEGDEKHREIDRRIGASGKFVADMLRQAKDRRGSPLVPLRRWRARPAWPAA